MDSQGNGITKKCVRMVRILFGSFFVDAGNGAAGDGDVVCLKSVHLIYWNGKQPKNSSFYLVFGSFVAGVKTLLAFRSFLHTGDLSRCLCPIVCFLPNSDWRLFTRSLVSSIRLHAPFSVWLKFFANVRNSQSVSALTDNKSRESNALQTKYINKFCLCSALFSHSLPCSLGRWRPKHVGNDLETTSKHTSDSSLVLIRWKFVRTLYCKLQKMYTFTPRSRFFFLSFCMRIVNDTQ